MVVNLKTAKALGIDFGNFNFNRDFGAVFDAPAKNVFLVKFAYWFNP